MKYKVGNWVIVTKRLMDGPEVEMKGKVVEATRDYAVAECWYQGQVLKVTMSEDTQGIVFFRRMDFRR